MNKLLTLLLMIIFAVSAQAQSVSKASNSRLAFTIKNAGIKVNGSFKKATITAKFDPKNTASIKLKGVAKASSVTTGIGLRDRHIKEKSEFFNTKKYFNLTMESYKVQKVSEGKYTVYWKLTMKGITKNIKTTMYAKKAGSGYTLTTSFKINRLDWKVGGKSFTMGDIVTVNLSTTLS